MLKKKLNLKKPNKLKLFKKIKTKKKKILFHKIKLKLLNNQKT